MNADVHSDDVACTCSICRLAAPFDLPDALLAACQARNVVLFAGAGVSTESHLVLPQTFYESICEELGIDPAAAGPFPDLMTSFVDQPNGRRLLLRRIWDRFSYIRSFTEVHFRATRFHRELATIYPFELIVTTNWDEFFEQECGATPFITGEDFAFWDVPGRKVFKIHGSASSYGSLVATRADYDACYERLSTGLAGSNLRMMLATKTVLYVGFSFRDDDFVRLHDLLSREMGGLRPQSYIVTLDSDSDDRFRAHGLHPIYTDATHFVAKLKSRLVDAGVMLPDSAYDGVVPMLSKLRRAHSATADIDARRYPDVLYSLFYQDGLHHALERILTLRSSGFYSHVCNSRDTVLSYEDQRKAALRARRFEHAAYLDGYMNGHVFFLGPAEMRRCLPLYFLHGPSSPITSMAELKRHLHRPRELNSRASRAAAKHVMKYPKAVVLHHPPWL
ncbi:MAG: SIR2 family protein [Gemmatimonadota bacterium]|nr:SIR2 family protein [Gemmatimonadota bacterium]